MLRLDAAIRGDLRRFMAEDVKAGERAVTSQIRRRTTALKNALRKQVERAGLGSRAGKTIRGDVYPERGQSISARGRVKSNWTYKRAGGLVDLITVFDSGATIRPRRSKYLAIPLFRRAGIRNQAAAPSDFPRGSLRFIPVNPGRTALLVDRETEEARFLLVRRTRIDRRLNLDAAIQRATRGLDDLIARDWERRARRAGIT